MEGGAGIDEVAGLVGRRSTSDRDYYNRLWQQLGSFVTVVTMPPSPRAFKMRLIRGAAAEYRNRHDAIWPELSLILRQAGATAYSIYLDEIDGQTLFAVITETALPGVAALEQHPIMRSWWSYMADLMEVDDQGRPRTWPLTKMFDLP